MTERLHLPIVSTQTPPNQGQLYELAKTALREALEAGDNPVEWLWASLIVPPTVAAQIDCKKGCAHCCHITVDTFAREIDLIASHIAEYLDQANDEARTSFLSITFSKLRVAAKRQRELNANQYLQSHTRCPFLTDTHTCGIYVSRPSACRVYASTSERGCHRALYAPKTKRADPLLPRLQPIVRAYVDGTGDTIEPFFAGLLARLEAANA